MLYPLLKMYGQYYQNGSVLTTDTPAVRYVSHPRIEYLHSMKMISVMLSTHFKGLNHHNNRKWATIPILYIQMWNVCPTELYESTYYYIRVIVTICLRV